MMINEFFERFLTIAFCDAAEPWQLGFQDAATPIMQGIIDLHHDIFFFLILILVFVLWMLVRALWHFNENTNPIPQRIVHGTTIEIIWTIFPSIILMFIAIPSFALLYSMDEVVVDPAVTIKAIGHQWYWTYEYSDYNSSDEQSLTFDSYMIPEDDLELGQLRLLEVDNRVVVPAKTTNKKEIPVEVDMIRLRNHGTIAETTEQFLPTQSIPLFLKLKPQQVNQYRSFILSFITVQLKRGYLIFVVVFLLPAIVLSA
ncbi:cytochrome c oxidase subunit 2 [Rhynchospora pubera]|uniref:Cytochrome c oxidase subunit 2 n=1 Tax=Rhynchospora pubera TaxID=906938 RepID=A0AAV8G1G1_9POAL|nr:cytochrome c oxidase subunit 2 [Rhynchospora pubera]